MKKKYEFESDYLKLYIEKGILFAHYKPGVMFDINVSKIIVNERLKFLQGNVLPIIIIDEGIISIDRDARNYFASPEGTRGVSAAAFIETTYFSTMLIKFFLGTNAANIPSRSFNCKEKAIDWIKNLSKENSVLDIDK